VILELLQAITGVFVVVYDGQHGLRFTLGRAKEVVGPGVHWKWPIFQAFRIEETKHTTLDLQPQVIQLEDDLVYEIDCKVVYQIVNLHKALINVDDLVTGLQNRVVMAVQRVIRAKERATIRDTVALAEEIRAELRPVEDQWGVRILQFGFSNISPSPATLEITQLDLLAREKLGLYRMLREEGLSEESAVALISGAVVALGPEEGEGTVRERKQRDTEVAARIAGRVKEEEEAKKKREAEEEEGEEPEGDEDET
jgi:regulator of protease activity HflC (stomatin/prohibitin superfamily)